MNCANRRGNHWGQVRSSTTRVVVCKQKKPVVVGPNPNSTTVIVVFKCTFSVLDSFLSLCWLRVGKTWSPAKLTWPWTAKLEKLIWYAINHLPMVLEHLTLKVQHKVPNRLMGFLKSKHLAGRYWRVVYMIKVVVVMVNHQKQPQLWYFPFTLGVCKSLWLWLMVGLTIHSLRNVSFI